jgi:hypothetical protein
MASRHRRTSIALNTARTNASNVLGSAPRISCFTLLTSSRSDSKPANTAAATPTRIPPSQSPPAPPASCERALVNGQVAQATRTDYVSVGREASLSPNVSPNSDIRPNSVQLNAMNVAKAKNAEVTGKTGESGVFPGPVECFGSIAQRLEQGSHKPLVLGSNPSAPMAAHRPWWGESRG